MKKVASFSVQVKAELDDEAGVWVATSDDVPGLVVEDADFQALMATVMELIPALLIENNMLPDLTEATDVPVHIAAQALAKRNVLVAV